MQAEGGHVLKNTVFERSGAGAGVDYMFSQATSTALSGKKWPNSFQGKPLIFFVFVLEQLQAVCIEKCESYC